MKGTFWLADDENGPHREGTLAVEDSGEYALQCFPYLGTPKQVDVRVEPHQMVITHKAGPAAIVADYMPRVVHGLIEDGTAVTLLDARMSVGGLSQEFTDQRLLVGDHLHAADATVRSVRWRAPGLDLRSQAGDTVTTASGRVEFPDREECEVQFTPERPEPIQLLADRIPSSVDALMSLWTARRVRHDNVYVETGPGRWCRYGAHNETVAPTRSRLLDIRRLGAEGVGRWIDLRQRLGPIPFIVAAEVSVLQRDAQVIAAALEGAHRRLFDPTNAFAGVTNNRLQGARDVAARAAVERLVRGGWTGDESAARRRFRDALAQVGERTYKERLQEILVPVHRIAPGLVGPSPEAWIAAMTKLRNELSHQLSDADAFDEDDIGRYYVLWSSARWVLRIRLLLELNDPAELQSALRGSSHFRYALANIDREKYWPDGYSCLEEFERAAID